MNSQKAWATYVVLRLLFFVVPFAGVFWLTSSLSMPLIFAAVIAAVLAGLIAMSLSLLFLSRSRERAAESIYAWRHRDRTADDVIEDEVVDQASTRDQ